MIGLGRLWETRHKPSLARLQDRFRVTAVYDQVSRRAEMEAEQLGCSACHGLAALVERPDVDVIYLLSPQWFGLHPAHLACDAGKAGLLRAAAGGQPGGAGGADATRRPGRHCLHAGIRAAMLPATLRLKELLATSLGPPRLILGHTRLFGFDRYALPGPATQIAPAPLLIDPGSYLLDWCAFLFQSLPVSLGGARSVVFPAEARRPSLISRASSRLFAGGAMAQIAYGRYHRAHWGEASRFLPASGFQVYAERGAAWLEMPERIQWWDQSGTHDERLPLEPTVGDVLNDQFHRLVRKGQSLAPTIHDALDIARLVHRPESKARPRMRPRNPGPVEGLRKHDHG